MGCIFVTKHHSKMLEEVLKAKCQFQCRLAHSVFAKVTTSDGSRMKSRSNDESWQGQMPQERGFLYVKLSLDIY